MKQRKSQHGPRRGAFTIAELMVAMTVAGLISAACMVAFIAIQKTFQLSMARSGVRTNVVRLLDAMEVDFRNATELTAAPAGAASSFPVTLTIPQRYSDYERAGSMAGDPGRAATRVVPKYDTKARELVLTDKITVTYERNPTSATTHDVIRTVTWTPAGGAQTKASRVVATLPAETAVQFQSLSGTAITATDKTIVGRISAISSGAGQDSAPIALESTIFLRTKALP